MALTALGKVFDSFPVVVQLLSKPVAEYAATAESRKALELFGSTPGDLSTVWSAIQSHLL